MESTSPFEIKSFALPALEAKILELYDGYINSGLQNYALLDCLKDCMLLRKDTINQNFVFTQEAVIHIERINTILIESTAKVLAKAEALNAQMKALKIAGDDFLDNYVIEATIGVTYNNEESILRLDADENNGESNYHAMAEVLEATSGELGSLQRFFFSESDNLPCNEINDDILKDESLWQNWNFGLLGAPELRHISYLCYTSHILFED